MNKTHLKNLPEQLISENGGGFGFVCIWRPGQSGECGKKCTVGEWLSIKENQIGTWLIDGGWGGPPGPVYVRWDDKNKNWEYGGFNGVRFIS